MDRNTVEMIMKQMTYAVKALMQLQTCATNSIIQLRRDHYLLKVKGVSHEHKLLLRHAPILGENGYFWLRCFLKLTKRIKILFRRKLSCVSCAAAAKKTRSIKTRKADH